MGPAHCAGPMIKMSLLLWSVCGRNRSLKIDVCKKILGQITINLKKIRNTKNTKEDENDKKNNNLQREPHVKQKKKYHQTKSNMILPAL